MSGATIDEICLVALAEAFRGDGELLCHPMGPFPVAAGRLARASFEPDLMLTDTIAYAVAGTLPLGAVVGDPSSDDGIVVEGYLPFRTVFDQAWSGCRHVVMGASQMDRHGNQNFAAIGDYRRPKAQLLGLRGAPGNVINHTASYWIPDQARTFVESVDVVSGPGYDRVAALAGPGGRYHEIRRVVTEMAAYDFETPDRIMRLRTVHPGVSVDEVLAAAPFELAVPDEVPVSRLPTAEELRLIRDVIDPTGIRKAEFRS
jgi:acyl CoA:acetate/3-ketoacid CoA transferase beta subunit